MKMAFFSYSTPLAILFISTAMSYLMAASAGNFYRDVDINWGNQNCRILKGGRLLTLSLDHISGSGFQSKNEYLFGRFDMRIKLVRGNSAGTVTTFFLSSQGPAHDEIDFEFLGNLSGQPYTVQTNIYAQGKGDKEERFQLWFDPTTSFHNYSVVWNRRRIIFLVENIPISVFENKKAIGIPFPDSQPMRVYSSLWNADDWATEGGRVKTDWTKAPFIASYRNFNANACIQSSGSSTSSCFNSFNTEAWQNQELDAIGRRRLRWVQKKYRIYYYCADRERFPQGLPPECIHSRS